MYKIHYVGQGNPLTAEQRSRRLNRFLSARLWLAGMLLLIVPANVRAQDRMTPDKYWVFFADKSPTAPSEAVSLTKAAARRRAARAASYNQAIDLPVSAAYTRTLADLGFAAEHESRWLNAVSVRARPVDVEVLEKLPFVRSVQPVGSAIPTDPTVADPATDQLDEVGSRGFDLAPTSFPFLSAVDAASLHPSVVDYGSSATQLTLINAIDPLERGYDGSGIVLGFLDTEFDTLQHPVFSPLVSEGRLLGAQFFTPNAQSNRHGVSVASVAVGYAEGQLIGPAHGAKVYLATTEYAPSETNQEEDAFVAGLEWLESQGVDVVNSSLGYTTFDAGQTSYTTSQLDGDTGITTRAVDLAVALGVVFVNSAGNDGCTNPASCWYYIGTPADADSVITVGAATSTGAKASFSSFGPTADGRIKPEVAAMGQNVYVAGSTGYSFSGGTSFSSPMVAAVACQVLQANPDLTPMQVRGILMQTASQSNNPDNSLGHGIVNAGAAVDLALSMVDTSSGEDRQTALDVSSVFPNPTSGNATLVVNSASASDLQLEVFDLMGRRVSEAQLRVAEGDNFLRLPTSSLSAGLYLVRVRSGNESISRRLSVIN